MMINRESTFFDAELRLRKIDRIGDPLLKLDAVIDWDAFKPTLANTFAREVPAKGPGGRPPYDFLLRFKVLILQSLYNLSDDAMEYQLNDRRTFQRFIGLEDKDPIPDAKSIWNWRESLSHKKRARKLFNRFWAMLEKAGVQASNGSIVDASFIDVPKQRNSKDENTTIKKGGIPEDWKKPINISKLRQKDIDARWAKKGSETHYGYKNHVKVDRKSKLIQETVVTNAAVHDSQALSGLLAGNEENKMIFGDSAYSGKDQLAEIKRVKGIPKINRKGVRGRPLTKAQKVRNRTFSRIRARVEHVFGFMTCSMGGMVVRSIGFIRAETTIILKNLAYNMKRYCVLTGA